MDDEIKYRTLTADDINQYRKIRLNCLQDYPENFGALFENEVKAENLKFDDVLQKEESQSFLYGALIKEEIIAICGFIREDRIKSNHRGQISQMCVRKDFAGQKIGSQLLKFTLEKAFSDKTLEIIELGVIDDNQKAIQLYLNFGFVKFGQLEKYFKYNDKYWTFTFMALTKENFFEKQKV